MEPVLEVPAADNRKSEEVNRRTPVGQQPSPRHSLLFDDQGQPMLVKSSGKLIYSNSSGDSPIVISDANSLKRKLHNLFLSGPSLRLRHSDGSLGSTASASPVSTGSPMEWPSTDITPASSTGTFFTNSYAKTTNRDITLEEELQVRLTQMTEVVHTWHSKWRQEREDLCRLTDHLVRCENESRRILEGLSLAYAKKLKVLEETLIRAMKTNEQLMIEKGLLESRLNQSKEIIDLQKHEIEQEFSRARKDVEQLRMEVGSMQSRTQRLETENDKLKAEKQLLTNDLKLFTGSTKKFNTTMRETTVRCELYRMILDIAMEKLKMAESVPGGMGSPEEKANVWRSNQGRFVLRVDPKNPTVMHMEDVHESLQAKAEAVSASVKVEAEPKGARTEEVVKKAKLDTDVQAKAASSQCLHVIRELEIKESTPSRPKTRYLPVVHVTSELSLGDVNETRSTSHYSPSTLLHGNFTGRTDRGETNQAKHNGTLPLGVGNGSPSSDGKLKVHAHHRRHFSWGRDNLNPKSSIKHLGSAKSDMTMMVVAPSKAPTVDSTLSGESTSAVLYSRMPIKSGSPAQDHDLPRHRYALDDSVIKKDVFHTQANVTALPTATSDRRPRSYSDSDDFNIALQDNAVEYSDDTDTAFMDIQHTTYRPRSSTLDGDVEKPRANTPADSHELRDSQASSNEELHSHQAPTSKIVPSRKNGFLGLTNPTEPTGGKSFVIRKYKTKDISDLFKKFTSDKDRSGKNTSIHKKKGLFGK